MLKSFSVEGLNGKLGFSTNFQPDLNLITGRNGSGKTTVLKLLWYMISGNLERIPPEITFHTATLVTDNYSLTARAPTPDDQHFHFELSGPNLTACSVGMKPHERESYPPLQELNNVISSPKLGGSVFFPTFRRIEGGFAMTRVPSEHYYYPSVGVDEAMARLSSMLTVDRHRLVASISTNDIVSLLTKEYADISDMVNQDHRALTREITSLIEEGQQLTDAGDALASIKKLVGTHSEKQAAFLKPFTTLSNLIAIIFQHHKGIQVTERITLGEALGSAEASIAISSAALSAGEKQMLSFLAYNAFERSSVIFIDEPEISLHVDWQRLLFKTLLEQGTDNQFVVATHSPFIYSKYADKEILLSPDRGGE